MSSPLYIPGKPRPRRLAVLGLDGVACTLLRQLTARGDMPCLTSMLAGRDILRIDSTQPPVSAVAWTTLYTGANPGTHNVFGFYDLAENSYRGYYVSSRDVRAPSLWELAGEHGLRSLVLNVPQTYPAKPLQGTLVAGFPVPDLKEAVYPPRMYDLLMREGYRADPDTRHAARHHARLLEDLRQTLAARRRVALELLRTEPWNLCFFVITETDRLHHFLHHVLEDEGHPLHGDALGLYREIDGLLGEVFELLGEHTDVALLSDHGFSGLHREFSINRWLMENGYLSYSRPDPATIEDMNPASRAFGLDPSRIYLHWKDRYPQGCVLPGSSGLALREEIAERLGEVRDPWNGKKVVERVWRREELFAGPYLDRAPDLVVSTAPGYDPKGAAMRPALLGHSGLTGMHTADDAFLILPERWEGERPRTIEEAGVMLRSRFLGRPPARGPDFGTGTRLQ